MLASSNLSKIVLITSTTAPKYGSVEPQNRIWLPSGFVEINVNIKIIFWVPKKVLCSTFVRDSKPFSDICEELCFEQIGNGY
jgi:hypothetical protein